MQTNERKTDQIQGMGRICKNCHGKDCTDPVLQSAYFITRIVNRNGKTPVSNKQTSVKISKNPFGVGFKTKLVNNRVCQKEVIDEKTGNDNLLCAKLYPCANLKKGCIRLAQSNI